MSGVERMPLSEVRDLIVVGEPLPFRVLEASGMLLLNQEQVVATDRQFEALVSRGAWVERSLVDEVRKARGTAAPPVFSAAQRLHTLFDLWDDWSHQFTELVNRASRGRALAGEFETSADTLLALIKRDGDVALFVCVRQYGMKPTLYPAWHAMHCAVACAMTAAQLNWPAAQEVMITRAALTMNIGMVDLQATLAGQREAPEAKQLDGVRKHPLASAELLRQLGVSDDEWLQTVQAHHERPDGSGYPQASKVQSDAAQLLRIADVFMAKLSGRSSRAAMLPALAARQIFAQHGQTPLAMALIRSLGIHPPGALVQLQSGEVAVVSRRAKAGPAPLVAALSSKQGKPTAATQHRDSAEAEFAITGPLLDTKAYARILPERVFGMIMA